MKLLIITALAVTSIYAQKVEDPKGSPPIPNESVFTADEIKDLQISFLKIHLLKDEYKIDEFNAKALPLTAKQQAIQEAACKRIGVAPDKINAECGVQGFGKDGDPVNGPDGKPIPPKVFRIQQPTDKTK